MNDKGLVIEKSVRNVFVQAKYVIPIYQRNYAWEQDQIERLMEDIVDFNPNEQTQEYVLGNLIVDKVAHQQYSVIDGQQRLTTLFLLLNYLKNDNVKADSLIFDAREKSNVTLKRIYNDQVEKDEFTANEIITGYNVVEQYFAKKATSEPKIDDFKKKFVEKLDCVKLLQVQVPKDIDLNHYFEIMNTRGEQLELHEIAKARLLQEFKDSRGRGIASIVWDACSDMSSYVQMNFDKNIRYLLFGEQHDDKNGWNRFLVKNFDEIAEKMNGFDQRNQVENHRMLNILTESEISNTDVKQIENDQDGFGSIIDFPNFLLQVNAANGDLSDDEVLDDKYFMQTLQHNWSCEQAAKEFIYSLLQMRFKFDKFIIKRERGGDLDDQDKWSLKQLRVYQQGNNHSKDKPQYENTFNNKDKNQRLLILQGCMRITFTSPKVMHWITQVIQKPLEELTDSDKIISILENFLSYVD